MSDILDVLRRVSADGGGKSSDVAIIFGTALSDSSGGAVTVLVGEPVEDADSMGFEPPDGEACVVIDLEDDDVDSADEEDAEAEEPAEGEAGAAEDYTYETSDGVGEGVEEQ